MNCENCGAPLRPGIRFCPNCGTGVDMGEATRIADPGQETVSLPPETLGGATQPPALAEEHVVHGGAPCRSCGAATVPGATTCEFCGAALRGHGTGGGGAGGTINRWLVVGGIAAAAVIAALTFGFCALAGGGDDTASADPSPEALEGTRGALPGAVGSPRAGESPSPSASPSASASPSPSASPQTSPSPTATNTATTGPGTPTSTPTRTPTPPPGSTNTPTSAATATNTGTASATATSTATPTNTATATSTPTPPPTNTPTPTPEPVEYNMSASSNASRFSIGDTIQVCWDVTPASATFTLSISHQTIREIVSLGGQSGSGCYSYEATEADATAGPNGFTIVVQAAVNPRVTLTVTLSAAVQ